MIVGPPCHCRPSLRSGRQWHVGPTITGVGPKINRVALQNRVIVILAWVSARKAGWDLGPVSMWRIGFITIRIIYMSLNLSITGSANGLSPDRHQDIIWTNAGILLIGRRGTNFNEILIKIQQFSLTKMALNMSSGKWRPICLGLNVLILLFRRCLFYSVHICIT